MGGAIARITQLRGEVAFTSLAAPMPTERGAPKKEPPPTSLSLSVARPWPGKWYIAAYLSRWGFTRKREAKALTRDRAHELVDELFDRAPEVEDERAALDAEMRRQTRANGDAR